MTAFRDPLLHHVRGHDRPPDPDPSGHRGKPLARLTRQPCRGGKPAQRLGAPAVLGHRHLSDDDAARLDGAASAGAACLILEGFEVSWLRVSPAIRTAAVSDDTGNCHIEWAQDSDFRFFPVERDPVFGYRLHMFDLATNKVNAAAGRREARDIVDLVEIDRSYLPLGPLIAAAVEKSPGFTPEGLIAEIRRNAHRPAADYASLASTEPIDAAAIHAALGRALDAAEAFVTRLPSHALGAAFLLNGKPAAPDPADLSGYVPHRGSRRGHWPDSPEIRHAMWRSRRGGLEP